MQGESDNMEKKVQIGMLCEIYGNLLTKRQLNILNDYCNEDLSLTEIAENNKITRQAVNDIVKKGESKLLEYEQKLGIMKKTIDRVTKMENILDDLIIVVEKSDKAMNELADCLKNLNTLKKYYQSQYMKDVMADKRHEIPQDLKRGVLSEDAVETLLIDLFELSNKMAKLSKKIR